MNEATLNQLLKEKGQSIGASDAAAVCGMSRWDSQHTLFLKKLGLLETEETEYMRWGIAHEATIADEYQRRFMSIVVMEPREMQNPDVWSLGSLPTKKTGVLYHPDYPWMLCHIDRVIMAGKDKFVGMEIKTADAAARQYWGAPGTDEIPQEYIIQVQHCMAVSGLTHFKVVVLFGGNNMQVYEVPRDEEFIELIIMLEETFMEMWRTKEPPPVDESEGAKKFLDYWYQDIDDVEIPVTPEIDQFATKFIQARALRNQAVDDLVGLGNRIKELMAEANATRIRGPEYSIRWGKPYRRKSIDVKKLLKELRAPQKTVDDHTTEGEVQRKFEITEEVND